MATTTQYAYERIYEVLIDGAGTDRTLASADRFVRGAPPGSLSAKERSVRAKATPTVFAIITAAVAEREGEMTDSHQYRLTVELWRDHWLGYEGSPAIVEAELVAATDAFPRVRGALCFPGNLEQTTAGNATGLSGHALNGAGARSDLIAATTLAREGRLLQFRDRFTAEFDYDPDA